MLQNDFYTQEAQGPFELYPLGDFELEEGGTIPYCQLVCKTVGTLNEAKDNAILFPHMYSGKHKDMGGNVGEGMALDPNIYFIIFLTLEYFRKGDYQYKIFFYNF